MQGQESVSSIIPEVEESVTQSVERAMMYATISASGLGGLAVILLSLAAATLPAVGLEAGQEGAKAGGEVPAEGKEKGANPAEQEARDKEGDRRTSWIGERVLLKSGNVLEGKVVKRSSKTIFLDIGHTILAVPLEEIDDVMIAEGPPQPADSPADAASAPKPEGGPAAERRESIFYTDETLKPGTIEEKAREVAASVVKVQCLQKSGSGFVIDDKEGYIVTNYHVIERERAISVFVYMQTDKGLRKVRKDKVRILAFNRYFDLALLKLEDREGVTLKKAYLGGAGSVGLGDPVFAIGSPLGLERTVSQGIVSNQNRAMQGLIYIQTTAAINPGNSGGALFNNRGEVIGVTNMKIRGGESLGFAIPSNHLKDFLRNFQAFAFDKDNPNTGIRYIKPPPKPARKGAETLSRTGEEPPEKKEVIPGAPGAHRDPGAAPAESLKAKRLSSFKGTPQGFRLQSGVRSEKGSARRTPVAVKGHSSKWTIQRRCSTRCLTKG